MSPVSLSAEISEPKFVGLPGHDFRNATRDLACDELKSASGRFVIEQNATGSVNTIGFPIVSRQFEARNFANSIGRARVKAATFCWGNFLHTAKHLARTCKVESALRTDIF